MFDNVSRFLVEQYPQDFASWLLGEPIALSELSPSELSLEPIRADALILLQSAEVVLHCEFQTDPDPAIPFRMADYALRVYRRFPQKRMVQVVIYLRPTKSELVRQTRFTANNLQHEFQVIRLWEQPTEMFLQRPGLLPYAVLSQTNNRAGVLREIAQTVNSLPEPSQQANIAAAAGILAGLVLDKQAIRRLLRRESMRESVIFQEWLEEWREEFGEEIREKVREEVREEVREKVREEVCEKVREEVREEVRQETQQDEARSLVLRLLKRRLGNLYDEIESRINALTLHQLEDLGEALLDFATLADLEGWLDRRN